MSWLTAKKVSAGACIVVVVAGILFGVVGVIVSALVIGGKQ